jgi:transcription elongation factor GreA
VAARFAPLFLEGKTQTVNEIVLTPDGYEKLKQEIDYLSGEKRREIADRIRIAREFGDISENAEYDDAKHEQALLERRISMLLERLRQARVLNASEVSADTVSIGTRVQLEDVDAGETIEYHIVGSAEADPAGHKLSNESPVGKAILGRK